MGRIVNFYLPGMFSQLGETGKYPGVSITGRHCDLNCDHCGAKILHTMPDCNTPEKLLEYAKNAEKNGALGMLVSGGSHPSGKLPWEVFANTLKIIKKETNLFLSVHCGFPDKEQMKLLEEARIDQALIDVIGSDEIARKVYHLPSGFAKKAVDAAFSTTIEVVPHILVGLNYGKNSEEESAIDILRKYNPKKIVIIALRPTKDTPMENVTPPSPQRVTEVIKYAKTVLPESTVNLGCARPVGYHKRELDKLALLAGVDGIAVPALGTYEWAAENGFEIKKYPTCCSMNNS
ncbi:MAG: radical SAM protein [Caldisericia bacterium]